MSADEKRYLVAVLRAEAERIIDRAGVVLLAEIARLNAEIARERARCGPACRHG